MPPLPSQNTANVFLYHAHGLHVPTAPANTILPAVTVNGAAASTAAEADVLACSTGEWDNDPTSYAYAWRRDGTPIGGATTNSYTAVAGDVGHAVTCSVTATGEGGSTAAVSNSIAVS